MLKEKGSLKDYLEGIGAKTPSGDKIPFIAVPTTSGTGSEATKNGVINGTVDEPFKKSFRHDNFVPNQAVLDPLLCVTCPPSVSAASGLDALTQLLESFVSTGNNLFTDAIAESGLIALSQSLESVVTDGKDILARGKMAYAAYCSGLCLGNADLGVIHGITGPLGGLYNIPHGVACGIILPHATEANIRELVKNPTPGSASFSYLVKYARAGYLLSGELESGFDIAQGCKKLIDLIKNWSAEFQLGTLSDYGVSIDDISKIAKLSKNRKNPVELSTEAITNIIKASC